MMSFLITFPGSIINVYSICKYHGDHFIKRQMDGWLSFCQKAVKNSETVYIRFKTNYTIFLTSYTSKCTTTEYNVFTCNMENCFLPITI
jgi:hypothetical protein